MKLSKDDRRDFASGDLPGYTEVEVVADKNYAYKDSVPATTICKKDDDGTFWAYDWYMYISHYGQGESEYYEEEIYQVERHEEVVTKTVVTWKKI